MPKIERERKSEIFPPIAYEVDHVDIDYIDNFVATHNTDADEKHWVWMGKIRSADGYPLFTFGSGPCTNLAFVSTTGEIILGHIPYVFVDHTRLHLPKDSEEKKVDALIEQLQGKEGWTLYLFSLAPYDDTERAMEVKILTRDDLMKRFTEIGVECIDRTTVHSNATVYGLIIDPNERKIKVCHKVKDSTPS